MFNTIGRKEEFILKYISNVGCLFETNLKHLKLTRNVIRNCMKKGLIYKHNPVFVFTQFTIPYLLTKKGKDLMSERYSISPYISNVNQAEHDYVLGSIYMGLLISEQDSWETEMDLLNKYSGGPVIDGRYRDINNNKVGVEVITSAYTDEDIKGKQAFIDKHCDKSIVIYTNDIFSKGD